MDYIFDTSSFIAFFSNDKGAGKIAKLLEKVERGEANGYVSPITLTELYYLYARKDVSLANDRVEAILFSKLKMVKIDAELTLKAEKYSNKDIPLANALIAAAAEKYGATVVAHCEGFEKIGIDLFDYEAE